MAEQEKRIEEQTKDAIEVLGFLKKDFENKAKPRCKFARVRAGLFFGIQALEKQISKKAVRVVPLQENFGHDYMCPTCKTGTVLNAYGNKSNYCPYCGQKLSWE